MILKPRYIISLRGIAYKLIMNKHSLFLHITLFFVGLFVIVNLLIFYEWQSERKKCAL
nr:hypothetical protein [Nitratiruptor tergarcus]